MRIAYIAPYQGPALLKRRPIVRNLSLGGIVKIGLIAELLQRSSHTVEILSQGEVTERHLKFYSCFREPHAVNGNISIYYSSAFPVRFLNGLWSSLSTLRIFKARHRISPFDVVLIYNLKPPQVACANYARRRLGLPVILEYEDEHFSDDASCRESGFTSRFYLAKVKKLLNRVSGCVAVSPHLLAQTPPSVPKLLLRGVVSNEIVSLREQAKGVRRNWIVFSGTHTRSQGLEQLIKAWRMLGLMDWELHIAGQGAMTNTMHNMAESCKTIVFHGLLGREDNARLLKTAKIGIAPFDISQTPDRGFSFKIIEYLAAGLHVVTTPRGFLEPQLETGISYIADNSPDTIAAGLRKVIHDCPYEQKAQQAALQTYGPEAVSKGLNRLIEQAMAQAN